MANSTYLELISLWLDDALSEEQMASLEKRLEEDRDARRTFLVTARLHAEMCNEVESQELIEALSDQDEQLAEAVLTLRSEEEATAAKGSPILRLAMGAVAVAATLLLGFFWVSGDPNSTEVAESLASPMITGVQPADDRCSWYIEGDEGASPQTLRPGNLIRVTDGALALTYTHGTNVVLHSPAAYQLVSAFQGKMIVGRLTATVPEAGKGFTVITPRADVIDLGTEFGVSVENDGATDVVVFKGEVDLDYHSGHAVAQRLRMGEAVRLDPGGTASRLVSVDGRAYSGLGPGGTAGRPVITEVRDNIERDTAMLSYYEIVHGGMLEDALSHVDRIAHEYNGLTESGMPSYLLGADYVKVFNNDKNLTTLAIEVTVSRPALVYVLLDDRHTPPEWLTDRFTDTGDDMGLDNGPFQSNGDAWHNKGPSGVGPGESIDDTLSIWVTEVAEPGVVRLGAVGTDLEVGGANMYGIAAAPLGVE